MAEYAEYQQNNLDNILHFNYGVELFPNPGLKPAIQKSSPTEALLTLKKLLRNNGFAFLTGNVQYFYNKFAIFKFLGGRVFGIILK